MASAAVALVLGAQGVDHSTALSIGIAFGAVELLTAAAVGLAAALTLSRGVIRPHLRVAMVTAGSGAVVWAFGATVVLPAVS